MAIDMNRILVANRGEIASRIIRAIHSLGLEALAVYSEQDRELPFVEEADEAYCLGEGSLAETYLDRAGIIAIARKAGADALHPGYGFLSEDPEFARMCGDASLTFIGPSPEAIALMGDKARARERARELGIPVLEGFRIDAKDWALRRGGPGFPVLVKAAAGGGGKGMRLVGEASGLESAIREARREALAYFGSGELYLEKFLDRPRHIEVQVMADRQGNVVHLFDRECSLQRRNQKIIEEAPSPSLSEEQRESICQTAVRLTGGISYTGAGTVEFLMDREGSFYFLEMNTRIQVEHPPTEMICGVDLVAEQIRIARGEALSFRQEDLSIRGHAIECRLYAEDPSRGFMPATGRILNWALPSVGGLRIESGYRNGNSVSADYDPLLAKLICHGKDREQAREKMIAVLEQSRFFGIGTNRDFLYHLLHHPAVRENSIHTRFIDEKLDELNVAQEKRRRQQELPMLMAAALVVSLSGEEGRQSDSVWKRLGRWRLRQEIWLRMGEKDYRLPCQLSADGSQLEFQMEGRTRIFRTGRKGQREFWLEQDSGRVEFSGMLEGGLLYIDLLGVQYSIRRPDILDERFLETEGPESRENSGRLTAPLTGRVVGIELKEGDLVQEGQALLTIESMKMENRIMAPVQARIDRVHVKIGEQVRTNQILISLASNEGSVYK